MRNNIINVVGGLIIKNQKLLICQRTKNKDHGLKWEFPGGKIEDKETKEIALIREIQEELSITIQNYSFLTDYLYTYKDLDKHIHLNFYLISKYKGEIKNNLHNNLNWIEKEDLPSYDFLEGDKKIIDQITNNELKIY